MQITDAVTDVIRRTLGGKKTTIGSARVLFFNCKNQSDEKHWYTGMPAHLFVLA